MARTVREDFAERLKQALEEAGYGASRQKELGLLFGVTPQAVRKWLNGEAMPTPEHAPRVAARLGVRRAWLLDNELPMRPQVLDMAESGKRYAAASDALSISDEEFRLLAAYRTLPKHLRLVISELADAVSREMKSRR